MRYFFLFFLSALFIYDCSQPVQPPPPAQTVAPVEGLKDTLQPLKPILSITQMDSFIHLHGKPISLSLWQAINVDHFTEMPDTVGVLIGNLDKDPEKEMVIWYRLDLRRHGNGQAMCFDKRGQDWHFTGETELDFWPAPWIPRVGIDPDLKMLLIYEYGWGSSQVESDGVRFWQCKGDSLIQTLDLTLRERVGYPDGNPSTRTVRCKYKVLSKSQIMANYTYELASEEEKYAGKVFFRRRLPIPYFWDTGTQCFKPRFSKRFARLYGLHREHSEFEFDGYFDAELSRLREVGPLWVRHSLGNRAGEN